MAIQFRTIPANNRVPGVVVEIDPSRSNSGITTQRTLIIGQQLSTGTLAVNVPVISTGAADVATMAGQGSMLALMTARYRERDSFGEVWLLPLADDPGASAAVGTILFSGTATAAGTLPVYIGAAKFSVGVTVGMTAAQIAAAVVAALPATLPVTAGVTGSTVTFTAKNKGAAGNDIALSLAPGGAAAGESVPAGVTATITAMSGGATNPVLAAGLLALGDMPFDFIVFPYTDTTSLTAIEAFLNDVTGRWAWNRMIYGHAFAAARGTLGALTTLGASQNSQHVSISGINGSLTWAPLIAADVAAECATSLRADPALPLQYVPTGIAAPPVASRFVMSDRNALLWSGISTFLVDDAGTVSLERMVTTYQVNGAGVVDDSYLDVETMFCLAYVSRDLRAYLLSVFGRKVLVSDDTPVPTGSNRVNASTVKVAIIARYRYLQDVVGIVQNANAFAAGLVVENAGRGLLKVLAPVDLANQLRQIAISLQFVKS